MLVLLLQMRLMKEKLLLQVLDMFFHMILDLYKIG